MGILVCDGDSITQGFGVTTPWTAELSLNANFGVENLGIGGETLAQMVSTGSKVDAFRGYSALGIVLIWGGTNDFANAGSTVSAVYASLQTYCANRRAAGWKVFVVTMISRTGTNPVGGETVDADKDAFNALIRANWPTFADGIADVASIAGLGADGAYSGPDFQSDGIHPNQTAVTTLIAPLMSAAINAYVAKNFFANMAITLVQAKTTFTTGGSTNPAAFASNVTVGNLIPVFWIGEVNPTTITFTDTIGNTYTNVFGSIQGPVGTGQAWFAQAAFAISKASGANTVTPTFGVSPNFNAFGIAEYSGIGGHTVSSELGQLVATAASTVTSPTIAFTPTKQNEVLVVLTFNTASSTLTPSGGFSIIDDSAFTQIALSHKITVASSTYGGTFSSAGNIGVVGAGFGFNTTSAGLTGWVNRERHFVNKR